MAARIIKIMGLVVLAAAISAQFASAKPFVADETFPAGNAVVAPNDRAGSQGIRQNSTDFGMGGQYGQNLIQQKAQDIQKAQTFSLPAPPDERPGTTAAVETPYLSIGGAASRSTSLVIPYLSHGVGVDQSQFSGSPVRPDDRGGARPSVPTSVPTSFAAPVSTTGGGFNWGIAGIGTAGLAALALAIGLLVALGRRSRHEGVAAS